MKYVLPFCAAAFLSLLSVKASADFVFSGCNPQGGGYVNHTRDMDRDGIKDFEEDKNGNCRPDPNETDPNRTDTDGDGIRDDLETGYFGPGDPRNEDLNGDGVIDERDNDIDADGSANGNDPDSDGDGLLDRDEDRNGNGFVDALGESSPNRADTDGDTINDLQEMADCRNNLSTSCRYVCRAGQLLQNDPYLSQVDSDGDGLFDWQEDWNSNCIYEEMIAGVGELNPFNDDTDGDGQIDSQDLCPTDATNSCTGQCRARQNLRVTDPNRDTDRDGLKDWEEDPNDNCIVEQGETDPTNSDTDGDGIIDRFDGCNSAGAPAISPDEFEQGVPTTPEEMTCAREQCVPGLPIPDLKDSDRDGAVDKVEDKNNNCLPETGGSNSEMDRFNPDGDEDELLDGVEDANKNGVVDKNETDPRNKDSDGDEIADGIEDRNHNGRVDADESSPLLQDSDGDKNLDKVEDLNHNGLCDKNEVSCAYLPDSDYDGLPDGAEDCNHNGVHDALEPDSRNADSDGDGLSDGAEDLNANCVLDKGETSPISPTTYGRPDKEFREEAVGLPTGCGMSVIPVSEEASANGARGFLFLGSLTLMLLVALRLRSRKSA